MNNIPNNKNLQLRSLVIRNPRRAAAMSTQIAMKLEREFIKDERPELDNGKHNIYEKFDELEQRRRELRNGTY